MTKKIYRIQQQNNELFVFEPDKKETIYSSYWFMEFGKTCAEVQDSSKENCCLITKKFEFWKWRMVYYIQEKGVKKSILISQNRRNTIFKLVIDNDIYEIKIHFKKKKSIYKNNKKIAEFDESFTEKDFESTIKFLLLKDESAKIPFIIYTSLLIGENELKSKKIMKSQKQLEKNEDPWS
ncbi:hypothetical protein [uncultured Polaribacter sp.]|uniref:hypothetical protein n=1 Tax=uncultured Polaribacter sp. TaxID=174711 RepID=UPI002604F497|nr:hypothetical protein [uncultured Polaribacter sp.]